MSGHNRVGRGQGLKRKGRGKVCGVWGVGCGMGVLFPGVAEGEWDRAVAIGSGPVVMCRIVDLFFFYPW